MEIHFPQELQDRLDEAAKSAGLSASELVQDVMAGYLDELAETGTLLYTRYDEIKSGRVQPVNGAAFFESLCRREDELFKGASH